MIGKHTYVALCYHCLKYSKQLNIYIKHSVIHSCNLIYLSHFFSYVSILSLFATKASSDSLSISNTLSKCLIEYWFPFPLF